MSVGGSSGAAVGGGRDAEVLLVQVILTLLIMYGTRVHLCIILFLCLAFLSVLKFYVAQVSEADRNVGRVPFTYSALLCTCVYFSTWKTYLTYRQNKTYLSY